MCVLSTPWTTPRKQQPDLSLLELGRSDCTFLKSKRKRWRTWHLKIGNTRDTPLWFPLSAYWYTHFSVPLKCQRRKQSDGEAVATKQAGSLANEAQYWQNNAWYWMGHNVPNISKLGKQTALELKLSESSDGILICAWHQHSEILTYE